MRNLAEMWKLMMPHIHQEDKKMLITHKGLYGESKGGLPKLIQNGLREQRRKSGLGFFMVKGGVRLRISVHSQELVWFKSAI